MADKKDVNDVVRANNVLTSATSRPIVTSQDSVQDPMVNPDMESDASKAGLAPPSSKKVISPISEQSVEPDSQETDKKQGNSQIDGEETATVDAVLGSKADNKQKEEDERREKELQDIADKLVSEGKYFLPINQVKRRRNNRIVIVAITIIILLGVAIVFAIRSGYIKLDSIRNIRLSENKASVNSDQPKGEQKVISTQPKTSKKPIMQGSPDASSASWITVKSGHAGFSIKIPDGWEVTNYLKDNNVRGDSLILSSDKPAKVDAQNAAYAGDGTARLDIVQFKNPGNHSYTETYKQKQAFSSGSLIGTRYYTVHPVEPVDGIGPLPGSETYTYEFVTQQTVTFVTYTIFNLNQYSKAMLQDQTKSDINQIDTVDSMVKTLEITQ